MGLFDIFRKKKTPSEAELRENLMWDMWAREEVASPHAELMTYESEVNNGGHSQYFFNLSNRGTLDQEIKVLQATLPPLLLRNFQRAYEAYAAHSIDDGANDRLFDECDDFFYENEALLIAILKEYANRLKL